MKLVWDLIFKAYTFPYSRQWLPREKIEPLGVDSRLDEHKLIESRKPSMRKNVQEAYKRAISFRRTLEVGLPDDGAVEEEVDEEEENEEVLEETDEVVEEAEEEKVEEEVEGEGVEDKSSNSCVVSATSDNDSKDEPKLVSCSSPVDDSNEVPPSPPPC